MSTSEQAVDTTATQQAHKGLSHWWWQRLSAVMLIPLTIWLTYSVTCIAGAEYNRITSVLGSPLNAVLIMLVIVVSFYHAALGMQVVFEDYVSTIKTRKICIVCSNSVILLLALAGVIAVFSIAFGG